MARSQKCTLTNPFIICDRVKFSQYKLDFFGENNSDLIRIALEVNETAKSQYFSKQNNPQV